MVPQGRHGALDFGLEGWGRGVGPVVHRPLRRQTPRQPQLHRASTERHPLQEVKREKIELPKRSKKGEYDDVKSMKNRRFIPQTY
jgi:hypothetical protein